MGKRSKLKTKNKKHKAINDYPKEKLFMKSNSKLNFTTKKVEENTKVISRKDEVNERRREKKQYDTEMSLQKQENKANIIFKSVELYEKLIACFK